MLKYINHQVVLNSGPDIFQFFHEFRWLCLLHALRNTWQFQKFQCYPSWYVWNKSVIEIPSRCSQWCGVWASFSVLCSCSRARSGEMAVPICGLLLSGGRQVSVVQRYGCTVCVFPTHSRYSSYTDVYFRMFCSADGAFSLPISWSCFLMVSICLRSPLLLSKKSQHRQMHSLFVLFPLS